MTSTALPSNPPQKRKRAPNSSSATSPHPKKLLTFNFADCPLLLDLGLPPTFYQSGKSRAWSLSPTSPTYHLINSYVERSRTELGDAKILNILQIMTNFTNSPKDHSDDPLNTGKLRLMLWHGTHFQNIPKILQKGLKLPKRKRDPYFGPGIYFTDNFSYSMHYCKEWLKDKEGRYAMYLILSDVLLGDIHKTYELMPKAPKLKVKAPGGKKKWVVKTVESVLGYGNINIDSQGDQLINGCIWPLGEKITNPLATDDGLVPANEYVVYEARRVIPKYLVKVEFSKSIRI